MSYKPWERKGVRLGYLRGPIFWIDRTIDGHRYQVSTRCRTPEAAWREYQRFELNPEKYGRDTSATVDGQWAPLAVEYLAYGKNIKGTSEKHRETTARHLADWGSREGFGSIHTFTRAHVEEFIRDLREGRITYRERRDNVTGEVKHIPSTPGQPTVNRYLASLKGFLKWCRETNKTTNTADREVKTGKEQRNVRPPESIEPERWRAVAAQLDERWRCAQEVLLGSGLRYSELARVRAEDLRPGGIVVGESKGKVGRSIPVTPATLVSAKRLLELGGVPNDEASQMDHRLEVAAKHAGVKKYTAHHLRHTFATTVLRSKKVDLRTLQRWMGHASITTTEKYLHAVEAEEGMPEGIAPV